MRACFNKILGPNGLKTLFRHECIFKHNLSNEVNILNVCANFSILSINIGLARFPMLINTLLVVCFKVIYRETSPRHMSGLTNRSL